LGILLSVWVRLIALLCFGQTKPEKHCEPPRHALPDGSERGAITSKLPFVQ
jgi:hypothetical protein